MVEKDAKGTAVKFDKFKGKVVYGVNVASKCGYTASGYALLAKIAKMPNVEVAIFPCNQVSVWVVWVSKRGSFRTHFDPWHLLHRVDGSLVPRSRAATPRWPPFAR